jgi:hypothetical protein
VKKTRKVFTAGMMLLALMLTIGTGVTGTGEVDSEIKTLFQPLDDEARAYVEAQPLSSPQHLDLEAFAVYLVEKYDENLSLIIEKAEEATGKSLPTEDREDLKLLIAREHLHKIAQENIPELENATVVEVEPVLVNVYSDGMSTYDVFYTPMTADNPCPISHWIQVEVDVNGGNGLYRVEVELGLDSAIYTLYFHDEDHPDPDMDAFYDWIRMIYYGRIIDIEKFIVRCGRQEIDFHGIWDNGSTYAAGGQHGDMICEYTPDTTVYVSNVWNHAMGIEDRNPSMSKIECNPFGEINLCSNDWDGDGLTNSQEIQGWTLKIYDCFAEVIDYYHVTSDPYKKDTDGDGLTDQQEKEGWNVRCRSENPNLTLAIVPYEYHVSSDPQNPDIDSDGLNDLQEMVLRTDPHKADTDCDGAWDTSDGFEVESGMNPVDCDTDDDGLTDGKEIDLWIGACGYFPDTPGNVPQEAIDTAVSNAKNPDVDGDGMTDGEEIAYWETLGLAPEEAIVFVGDLDMNQNGVLDSLEHFPSVIRRRGLHKGTENSLVSKVENAIKSLEKGDCDVAINQLQAFINEIEAQRGKKISEELAEMLIQYAQNVIWQIEDWKKL